MEDRSSGISNGNARIVVILTALEKEHAAVRRLLNGWQVREHEAGTLFELASLPGTEWSIALARTGEGNLTAGILTERAIALFRPRAVLFVGVAGALKDDLDSGDLVVATKVYSYHGGKEEDSGFMARPEVWRAPHDLDQLARHVAGIGDWTNRLTDDRTQRAPEVHFKPVAAGEVVLNSRTSSLAGQLRRNYNDAVAIEMESAGVASAGHLNRSLPVLTVRGISDRADGAKHDADEHGWQKIAATNAAAFALGLVSALTKRRRSRWRLATAAAVAVLTIAVLGLVAFRPATDPPCCPDPVHLVLDTWSDDGSDLMGYDDLIAEYERSHPNVTVVRRNAPSLAAHRQRTRDGLIAGKDLGDVVAAEEVLMGDMYVDPLDWVDLAQYVDSASLNYARHRLDAGRTADGAHLLGLPTDMQAMAICYRRDLFARAGLPTDRDKVSALWSTWGDFIAVGESYRRKTGNAWLDTVNSVFATIAVQHGEPVFSDRQNRFVEGGSPGVRQAWTTVMTMIEKNLTARARWWTQEWSTGAAGDAFAVTACPHWFLVTIESTSGAGHRGDWDIATLPGGAAAYRGGTWLAVPTQSRHPKEAAELAAFLTSAPAQLAVFAQRPGILPSHLDAIGSPQVQGYTNAYFNRAPAGEIFTASASTTRSVYLGCRYTVIKENAFEYALWLVEGGGGTTPDIAFQQAVQNAKGLAC